MAKIRDAELSEKEKKEAERSEMVTLEMFKEVIDKREQEITKRDAEARQGTVELREKYEVLKQLKDKNQKTKTDVEDAMKKVLCFSNIAYCCSTPLNPHGEGKQCPFRDGFLDALGLTYQDFETYKQGCGELFWRTVGERVMGVR